MIFSNLLHDCEIVRVDLVPIARFVIAHERPEQNTKLN